MARPVAIVALVTALSAPACGSMNDAMTAHTDIVARAAGIELTVDEAATMLAPFREVPSSPDVVQALSDYWVDYVLLAKAVAADSQLRQIDVSALVRPQLENQVVAQLRDKVIQVDTTISEEELRREFEQSGLGVDSVRARHILLAQTSEMTQAQRDSVRRLAEQLRDRARGGEDFAQLARTYSQDPGSATQGGDLGYFRPGEMWEPFERAAFALDVGEVSDIAVTPNGLHVIKLEEKSESDFESSRAQFTSQLLQQRMMERQQSYLEGLTTPLNIEVQEGAAQNARDIAASPEMRLRGRAASRTLVRYQGGELTAGELQVLMSNFPPTVLGQFESATDEDIAAMLEGLTQNEILVAEAAKEGFEISEASEDSASAILRANLGQAVRLMGLTSIQPQDGETMNQAIERKVDAFLEQLLRGETQPVDLGPLRPELRDEFDAEVFERSFEQVGSQVEQIRASAPAAPAPTPSTPLPDTGATGGGSE